MEIGPTGPEKKCHNECGCSWCCTNEFFVDNVTRFDEESMQLFEFKGFEVRNFPLGDPRWGRQVIIKVPVTCKQMTKKGCKLKDKRPLMCKVFPNQFYYNWILHKDCCFYEKEKHWHWYDLTPFTPPKGIQ